MKKISATMLLLLLFAIVSNAQITGVVLGSSPDGIEIPLPNANIYWSDFQKGCISDKDGRFSIDLPPQNIGLIFSYIGYVSDTVTDFSSKPLRIVLSDHRNLKAVEIVESGSNMHLDRMNPILTQNITGGEMRRAACCSLAESFETNASVDVNYTDAISGAKQIQLLGLSGVYSQLLVENIPFMRGIGASFGMEYIPGTWLESIQISKGPSNIRNGFESITGQINAELKKPDNKEKFFFNYLANDMGRNEFNVNSSVKISEKVSTIVLGHYSFLNQMNDDNEDGFADVPASEKFSVGNFWQYNGKKGLEMRWGGRYINENRRSGQIENSEYVSQSPDDLWTSDIDNERYEVYLKTGFVFNDKRNSSIGFINSFSGHDMNIAMGRNFYGGSQKSVYSNLIFDSNFGSDKHAYNLGASFMYDKVDEQLNDSVWKNYQSVPGLFFQYIYTLYDKLTLMAGMRYDYNSQYGSMFTPRVHAKIFISEGTTLRLSGGIGYRVPYLIPENMNLLSSSRRLVFAESSELEKAANYGLSFVKTFDVLGREMTVSLEYYKTDFMNQILFDMESDTSAILIFNLNGKSYSHAAQGEISYSFNKWIEARAALRYNDVRYTFPDGVLREKPLLSQYKSFLTIAYGSNMKKWQADLTFHLNGKTRLPDRSAFPEKYRLEEYSPAYLTVNLQVTKNFKHWNIYAGVENLTNFKQESPIISADDPYSPYFDSGIIWGPISGRRIYAGVKVYFNR